MPLPHTYRAVLILLVVLGAFARSAVAQRDEASRQLLLENAFRGISQGNTFYIPNRGVAVTDAVRFGEHADFVPAELYVFDGQVRSAGIRYDRIEGAVEAMIEGQIVGLSGKVFPRILTTDGREYVYNELYNGSEIPSTSAYMLRVDNGGQQPYRAYKFYKLRTREQAGGRTAIPGTIRTEEDRLYLDSALVVSGLFDGRSVVMPKRTKALVKMANDCERAVIDAFERKGRPNQLPYVLALLESLNEACKEN